MRITFRNLLLLGAVMATTNLYGQNFRMPFHEVDGALTYNAMRSPQLSGGDFWQQGGGAELSAGVYRGLGIAANFAGVHAGNIGGNGANLTTITYLFGPRYTWTAPSSKLPLFKGSSRNIALFGEFLVGGAHGSDGVFYSPQGATSSSSSFAFQTGGGVDVHLTKRLAVRPIQLGWLHTGFPNGSANEQNNLRIGAGIVIRLQR